MPQSVEALSEKMQEMNLTNEVFYGEDLSSEENFLKALIESITKNFEQYEEISYYFKKKSMAFSFESLIMSKEGIKKLLEIVAKTLVEHFFDKALSKIGWCSNYRMDSRFICYPIEKSPGKGYIKKAQIIEFYWFNNSPVRNDVSKRLLNQNFICKCMHCIVFQP